MTSSVAPLDICDLCNCSSDAVLILEIFFFFLASSGKVRGTEISCREASFAEVAFFLFLEGSSDRPQFMQENMCELSEGEGEQDAYENDF